VEDPTRVFRAIRFEHRFSFHIGKHTLSLIKNAVKMNFLSKIQGKRIWTELTLILGEEEPEKVLKRLQDLDLLKFIYNGLTFDKEKERLFVQMRTVSKWYDLLYRGKPCNKVEYYLLGLTDGLKDDDVLGFCETTEMIESLRKRVLENSTAVKETTLKFLTQLSAMKKSAIYRQLEPLSQEARLFIMAKTRSEELKKIISNYITYADSLKPLLTGNDLKSIGIHEGPIFKEILESLKEAKIDSGLKTREDEIGFISDYLRHRGMLTEKNHKTVYAKDKVR
jgi:tRNA nucleotidyltransferase (CCA-adding enzyme)